MNHNQNENVVNFNESVDIVVIGSGAAGLTAALSAVKSGSKVVVLEKSGKLGGNTSISGGQVWVPNNHLMLEAGIPDSEEAAHAYLEKVVDGTTSRDVIDVFIKEAPKAIKYIEENTPLKFHSMVKFPDYRQDFPGSVEGGRTLDPDPIEAEIVGEWADYIHEGPHFSAVTYEENSKWNAFAYPENIDFDLIADRLANDIRTLGAALVVGLVKGCLDAGVIFQVNAGVDRLIKDNNRISGVEATIDGEKQFIEAKKGVVIASGGFEFNEEFTKRYLRGQSTVQSAFRQTKETV